MKGDRPNEDRHRKIVVDITVTGEAIQILVSASMKTNVKQLVKEEQGGEKRLKSRTCLLYTSRCV